MNTKNRLKNRSFLGSLFFFINISFDSFIRERWDKGTKSFLKEYTFIGILLAGVVIRFIREV